MCIHMLQCNFLHVSFTPLHMLQCHFLHVSVTLFYIAQIYMYICLQFPLFDIAYIILLQSLPEEYQVLLAQHNSLVEKDFDELAQAMKEQGKVIRAKRGA